MRSRVSKHLLGAVVGIVVAGASSASATISTGPGGQGVTVGNSSLIGSLDFADTFTGTDNGSTNPNRPYVAALQPAPWRS